MMVENLLFPVMSLSKTLGLDRTLEYQLRFLKMILFLSLIILNWTGQLSTKSLAQDRPLQRGPRSAFTAWSIERMPS